MRFASLAEDAVERARVAAAFGNMDQLEREFGFAWRAFWESHLQ